MKNVPKFYSDERSVQIVLSVLKANGIKKVIASPGTTNVTLVGSMQNDPWFEIYSSADERSAAYMACGLAAETGEAVVLSCTGATASRNYLPGLTEAFYRKLPILAITSNQGCEQVGHLIPQNIDRGVVSKDVVKMSVSIDITKNANDEWNNTILANKAVLELFHRGGGPVHINLSTLYSRNFSVKRLPYTRIISRYTIFDELPTLPQGKIGIFIASHRKMSIQEVQAIDTFCEIHNAIALCDHTSGYWGKYAVHFALIGGQENYNTDLNSFDLLIHIGEVSGDYYGNRVSVKKVWRVNEDGELRDTFRKLEKVFEMPEHIFFERYAIVEETKGNRTMLIETYRKTYDKIYKSLPELPFSNAWIAKIATPLLPQNSVLHLGILNTLRSWNMFELPIGVDSSCNVGGFGIDGSLSTIVGASLAQKEKLHFIVLGDLSFFYDMNVLGNRHIGNNLRIMLINNGRGTEFRLYSHPCFQWGESADNYMAAAGHYGNQSVDLVKHYVADLGFEYLSASNKEEFLSVMNRFFIPEIIDHPMILEVFTNHKQESDAIKSICNAVSNIHSKLEKSTKKMIRNVFGAKGINIIRNIFRK